jgi:hypothetical protein
MSYLRYILAPVFVSLTLLLTGALSLHPLRSAAGVSAPSAVSGLEDPLAAGLLRRAAECLSPEHVAWMRTAIWQRVACEDLTYQAEGSYLSGPNHRLHLHLNVRFGNARSDLRVISDGATLWQIMRVGDGTPVVTRAELARVLDASKMSLAGADAQAEFYQSQCLTGLYPLLQGLRKSMIVTRKESLNWNHQNVTRLTLTWSHAAAAKLTPSGQAWPAGVPDKCFLYLDAATLWPHRIEWQAPDAHRNEKIVFEMELRNPILNRAIPQDQCDREFSFDPGPGEVPDLTQSLKANVESRTRELAAVR